MPLRLRPSLRLRLSDLAQVERDGAPPLALAARDAALLAWLALDGPTSRERLGSLLWPASTEAQARTTLRQRLFQLKKAVGSDLATGSPLLGLAPGVEHDLHDAVDLLGGLSLPDAPELDAWLAQQREQRRQHELSALAAQAQALEDLGDAAAALPVAQALLRLDPQSEAAHRRVIRLHYLQGDRAAALLAFDRCEQWLKHEVGTRPSAETLALLATLEAAQAPTLLAKRQTLPASVLRPPRMVGRERELQQAQDAWQAGQVVSLSGEAGLGKSRLLQELLQFQPGTVMAQARPGDAVVPYAAAARLLRAVVAQMQILPAALRPSPLARLLPELADVADGSSMAAGAAPLQRALLVQAVTTLLQEAMAQGLHAMVLDDLHFADEATLDLLLALACTSLLPDLRWAFAARPAETGPAAALLHDSLLEAQRLAPLNLQALDLAQVQALITSLGLQIRHGDTLAVQVHRHTGGNPLFILETLRQACLESRLDGAELPTPLGVMRLIERRLARLSPQALRLARCAAVAGQDFSTHLAAHVLEVPGIDLAESWAELTAAQVLRDSAFAHDLILEATLASVPAPVARHLHGQVAAFLAAAQAEPARIAQHWDHAGNWAQAGLSYLPAAERAGLAGRRLECAGLLADAARCFMLSGDAAARFKALEARAETLAAHENGAAAQQAVADAELAAVTELDQLQALAVRAELHAMRGEFDPAYDCACRGLAHAQLLGQAVLVFRFTLALASPLGKAGRAAEAVTLLHGVQPWVESQASPNQARQYWSALALALDFSHRFTEAIPAWQRTRENAEHLGPDHVAQSINNQAWTLFKLGRTASAAEAGLQGLQLLQSSGEDALMRRLVTQIGVAFFLRHLGHLRTALPLFEEALPLLRSSQMAYWAANCEHGLAVSFEVLGQPARARDLLAPEHGGLPPHMQAMRQAFRAELTHLMGGDGLPAMREALALVPDTDHVAYRAASLLATRVLPPDEGEALATGLAAWAALRERFGLALSGHVRAAACALAQGAPSRALPHAEAAMHLVARHTPESLYLGEVWLTVAQVHAALGRQADVDAAVRLGSAWVQHIAHEHVPDAFVDSFLNRNLVNHGLLAWASRLGNAPGPASGHNEFMTSGLRQGR